MSTITIEHVSKIEGHANFALEVENGRIEKVDLAIFEGARFFESLLVGKKYDELPVISARICGICSPAHTVASLKAVEAAFGVRPPKIVKLLRELISIGGLIQSHILHLYFLVLPDYRGLDSAVEMREKHRPDINRALRIKKLGNRIATVVGGRDIHPMTLTVGGMSRLPDKTELESLLADMDAVAEDAMKTYDLFSSLPYPDFSFESTCMAIHERTLTGNTIKVFEDGKLEPFAGDYEDYISEYFQHDNTAEFVIRNGKSYAVGPQARIRTNHRLIDGDLISLLPPSVTWTSPFSNLIFQAFEIVEYLGKAKELVQQILELLDGDPRQPTVTSRAGSGIGVVEAPRGLLFHKYGFDDDGCCTYANVTTPTSQNLRMIEECLDRFVNERIEEAEDTLIAEVERLIRAFDPCMSCSSH